MSGADTDPVGGFVLALLAMVALALILPVWLAGWAVFAGGRTLIRVGGGYLQGPPVLVELQRVLHERNEAIREIVAIRHHAERQMHGIGTEGALEDAAEEAES